MQYIVFGRSGNIICELRPFTCDHQKSKTMDLPQPPPDQELKNIIDKLAQFVARNGPEFEHMTKQKQKDNPKFSFLFGGEYFNYYQYRVTTEQAILKQKQKTEQQQAIVQHAINQQSIQSAPWQQHQPQQMDIQEQIRQSEQNLAAQHQLLLQQQQVQVDDAIRKAQDEKIGNMAKDCNIDLDELANVLQPIIDCCTKDTISNGKGWIFANATSPARTEVITQYILKRVTAPGSSFETKLHLVYLISDILHHCQRKNADELKKTLDKVVVPIFCSASIGVEAEKHQKLHKVFKLWENSKYFSQTILDQLQNPTASLAAFQASLIAEYASLIIPITSAIQNQYSLLQKQHQDFVNHLTNPMNQMQPAQNSMIPNHQTTASYSMIQSQNVSMMSQVQQPVPPMQAQPPTSVPLQQQMEQVQSLPSHVQSQIHVDLQQVAPQTSQDQNSPYDTVGPQSNPDDPNSAMLGSAAGQVVLPPQPQQQQETPASVASMPPYHPQETTIPGPMFTGQPGSTTPYQSHISNGPPFSQYGNGYPPRYGHPPPPPPRFLLNTPEYSHTPPHIYNQPPRYNQPPPDIGMGNKRGDVSYNQICEMMDLVKAVDDWSANYHDNATQLPPQADFREQMLPANMPPYFDLPAGLMVPLVKLEDAEYKPLDPDDIKLPPPALPTERLLAAVEQFYSPPAREPAREGGYVISSDGWEQLGLYEFFKAKAQAKKRKQGLFDSIESGESSQEGDFRGNMDTHPNKSSPPRRRYRETVSPDKPVAATVPPVMKSRRSRSRSKSRSRSRSRSKSRSKPKSRSPSPQSPSPRRSQRYTRSRSRSRSRSPSPLKRRSPERSPTPPSFYGSTYANTSYDRRLDESNKGHQLLKKMGWGGAGLGAAEQGIQDPVNAGEVRDRQDMYKGIGVNLNDPYENFRKSKRQAFINRMKARAGEKV